jgi:hypothetical protein
MHKTFHAADIEGQQFKHRLLRFGFPLSPDDVQVVLRGCSSLLTGSCIAKLQAMTSSSAHRSKVRRSTSS